MKIRIFFFIFFYFYLFSTPTKAINILDKEIELFLEDIISLITSVNKFKKEISFTVILDDNPNAFINHENKLFISTGLIKYSESYEALVGVLAHEIGHLENFHISKRKKSIKNLEKINQFSTLSLVAGSLITKKNNYLVKSLISKEAGINNYYLSFSRDQEREADYYGIETLEKLKLSKVPLIKFLNLLEKNSIKTGYNIEYSKFSTHPVFKERYNIIENLEKNKDIEFDYNLNVRFNYIRAKLFGFTEKEIGILDQYLKDDYLTYASSIVLSTQGKLRSSIKQLNQLLYLNNSNYFFLLETKADILYSNGFPSEALLFYNKVINKYNDNFYIKKRIFDIKFTLNNIYDKKISSELFENYVFLLNIFINSKDLNNKFNKLAKILNKANWLDYFSLEKNLINSNLDKTIYLRNINFIKKETSDMLLIKLINKKIEINNE